MRRQMFKHLSAVFGILLCLPPGTASASIYQCRAVWADRLLPASDQHTERQVRSQMDRYRQILDLRRIRSEHEDFVEVALAFRQLTPDSQKKILQFLHEDYGRIKALKFSDLFHLLTQEQPLRKAVQYFTKKPFKSFKRQTDLLLSEVTAASQVIRKEISVHDDFPRALDAYYRLVQETANLPVRMEAQDVIKTAARLRQAFFPQGTSETSPIIIYGSFANGRSYPHSSDLDLAVWNSPFQRQINSKNLLGMLPDFPFSMAHATVFPKAKLADLGVLNHIVVLVWPNRTEFRIYHSLSENPSLPADHRPYDTYEIFD